MGHLTEVRGAELAAAAAAVPRGPHRTRHVLRMLGDHFASPVFIAALELWVAARTDPALLAAVSPLEQRVGRDTHRMTVDLLGADESRPGVRELVQATLDLVRGLGLAATTRSFLVGKWCSCAPRLTPARSETSVVDVPANPRSTSSSTVASSSRARIARDRSACGTRVVVTGPACRRTNKQSSLILSASPLRRTSEKCREYRKSGSGSFREIRLLRAAASA